MSPVLDDDVPIVTSDVLVFSPQTSPDIVHLSSLSIFLLIMIPADIERGISYANCIQKLDPNSNV